MGERREGERRKEREGGREEEREGGRGNTKAIGEVQKGFERSNNMDSQG